MSKTEYQKMLAGEYYHSTDKALMSKRQRSKQLCQQLSQLDPEDINSKKALLKALFPQAKGLWCESPVYCDYGDNVICEGPVFLNHHVCLLDGAEITIGSHTLIGPNTVLAATSHAIDAEMRRQAFCISRPINIGKDVWIGANVTILGGVDIADGAIIGAGVVVRESIASGQIVK